MTTTSSSTNPFGNTTNPLIRRYLAAIAKHLPAARRDDILAELSANLHAEFEDREEAVGHPLTLEEQAAVLKQHGHPLVVALRYLPQRSLIGPTIFPFYLYTLKRTAPLVLLAYFVTRLVIPGGMVGISVGHHITLAFQVMLYFWATVTLVFAGFEYAVAHAGALGGRFKNWDPTKLPEPKSPTLRERKIAPKHPMVDLVSDALFTLWLVVFPQFPALMFFGPAAHWLAVQSAPVWHRMYAPLMVLLAVRLILKGIAMDSHKSAKMTGFVYVAADVCSIAALALLVIPGETLFTLSPTIPAHAADAMNFGIMLGLKMALVAATISAAWKLWQTLRLSGSDDGMQGTAVCL